jgi:NADH:ubiquinone oxidoreductase subunit F (NADH-binding)
MTRPSTSGATPVAGEPTSAWPRRLLDGLDSSSAVSLTDHVERWGELPRSRSAGADAALIDTVDHSGLLGRGGAGFPTGRKMRTVAAGARSPVVVANGAEGEPASGKDALLLSLAPHLVLDGVQLAARAVGADEAHLVVHRGSPALGPLRVALAERRTRDAVAVTVHQLPVRYVASEESAVVHWLNGADAKPTFVPPRPFEQGVGKRPTLVNNVETLAHVAMLARRGPDWFRSVGDPDEPGTLLVTVTGPGVNRRVAEVPTGTPIGDVIDRAGLGPGIGSAVLVGGYFGTWLPLAYARQLPMTHRAMRSAGTALGAGVVAVLPGDRCGLRETARVAAYLAAHNAGQCGPCLNGLPAIAQALGALASGGWDDRLWPALERWMAVVPGRGACRHPDGAVRFVASALSVFADDIAEHRRGHPCAAATNAGWLPIPKPGTAGWR